MQVVIKNLPNGYRQRACSYCEFDDWRKAYLSSAFPWDNTCEGMQFWKNVYKIAEREGPLLTQKDINKLPTLPPLDIKAYRPSYIGWCNLTERSMMRDSHTTWNGIVTIYTAQPPFTSYFVTTRKGLFNYHDINERYWAGVINQIQILKKIH